MQESQKRKSAGGEERPQPRAILYPLRLRTSLKNLLFAATLMSLTLSSSFATTYTYTGNNYNQIGFYNFLPFPPYTTSMSVSGVLTLSSPLAPSTTTVVVPLSFSFFDGYQTIDNTLATNSSFTLRTDVAGNIDAWAISIINSNFTVTLNPGGFSFSGSSIETSSILAAAIDRGQIAYNGLDPNGSRGFIQNSPGIWLTDVPEPSTFGLMAFGMAISAVLARRQKRRNPSSH
jgi:hypothetical protein